MLRVDTSASRRHCDGVSRRDFLQVGALALGGLTLPQLLAVKAAQAAGGEDAPYFRNKQVVLLYLSGGASHIETFDPKMSAPAGIRSLTGEVQTTLPGVTFGGTFPLLAAHADKLAVVRSFTTPVGGHGAAQVHILSGGVDSGKQAEGFSMGSAYARLRGANHPRTGMPTYTALTDDEVDRQYSMELSRFLNGAWPGKLGPAYAPFEHRMKLPDDSPERRSGRQNESPAAANMRLNLPAEVLEDRLTLLRSMDQLHHRLDNSGMMGAVDKFHEQAINLVMGGASTAFDYTREDPATIARYDTSQVSLGFKSFRPSSLGKQLLIARRLCEVGCGFVSIHSAGWDMHADGNNPGMVTGMNMLGRTVDKGVSAFLEDLDQRGMLDDVLLVITGDFGRTPKVNNRGGRDHWSRIATLAFAGGGLNMGQVIGESARGADVPGTDPYAPPHLLATVMHTLFDPGQVRLETGLPRELLKLIETGQPIRELF